MLLPEELTALAYEKPWELFRSALAQRRALDAEQSDPELEMARRHARRGQQRTITLMFVGMLAPVIATLLAEWR